MTDAHPDRAGSPPPASPANLRRLLLVSGLLVALVVTVVVLAVVGRGDGDDRPAAREAVDAVLAAEPTAPVVLPVSLPAGYTLRAGDAVGAGQGRQVSLAAWVFDPPPDRPDLAIVQICVSRAAGGCTGQLAQGALARPVDDLDVAIVPFGEPAARAAALSRWEDTELTSRWTDLEWLD